MSGRRGWPGQEYAIYPGVPTKRAPGLTRARPLLGLPLPSPTLASCTDDRSLIYPQGGANPRRPRAQRSHHENSAPKGPLQVITSTTICRTTWSHGLRDHLIHRWKSAPAHPRLSPAEAVSLTHLIQPTPTQTPPPSIGRPNDGRRREIGFGLVLLLR